MKNNLLYLLFYQAIAILLWSGCAQSTKIVSEPTGANVYINGRLKGQTPLKITTTLSNHGEIPLSLSHPGHESIDTFLTKTGETDKFLRILGYIAVLPLDYDKKFKPQNKYVLKPKQQRSYKFSQTVTEEDKEEIDTLDASKIEKLRKIQKAYKEKLISREEYITLKKNILEGKE